MSFDLFFRTANPGARLTRDEFVRHFDNRQRYEVSDSQAGYLNEDTGVYFTFEYNEPNPESESQDQPDPTLLPIAFNLNYFRPHVFGLEAEPEVAAFVREFNLTVSDPQMSGMGEGEYSREGFLRSWNTGNAFGYQAIMSHDSNQEFLTLPTSRIEALWRWNYDRNGRQSKIGQAVFVPRIFVFDAGGTVQTAVAWGDGIPIVLPVVDLVLVPRHELAPRSWFKSKEDIVVFTWEEIEPIVQRFRKCSGEPESYELFYENVPANIERLICEKKPPANMPKGVAFDQVLDRELLEQVRTQLTNG